MHRTPSHASFVHHWISFLLYWLLASCTGLLHSLGEGCHGLCVLCWPCPAVPGALSCSHPSSCSAHTGAPESSLSARWERPPFLHSHMAHPPQQPSPHSAVWAERTLANYAGLKITTLPCFPAAGPICVGPVVRGNKVPPVEPGRPQVWSYRYKQEGNEGNNYQLLQVKAPLKLQ